MNANDLAAIRSGAEMQSVKPYMDQEIGGLQKSVVSFVLAEVNKGTLTPEIAFAKWVEYTSYIKLQQKLDQRIAVGKSVGENNAGTLDFSPKVR